MIRTLLVGLDGSRLAESVLPYAERLGLRRGARIILAQAVSVGETLDPLDLVDGGDVAGASGVSALRYTASGHDSLIARSAVAEADEYLAPIAQRLRARGCEVHTAVAVGDPTEVLLDVARARQADLILLGTHGRSGLGRWLYGSVAEAVLARSPIPTLLVPASLASGSTGPAVARILVPLDGSAIAEAAIGPALDLAEALAAEVALVRIVPPTPPAMIADPMGFTMAASAYEFELEEEEKAARAYLAAVAAQLRARGLSVTTSVRVDQSSNGILAAADVSEATLVVMATHGRTGLSRALLGSVALDVLRRGTRPVVLVHPVPTAKASDVTQTEAPAAERPGVGAGAP